MAENLFLPKTIEYQPDKENKNKGTVVITPCYPGYGTTLGSALRRVLLSSLAGVAIDAVKIKGARHEFGTLPGIKEDLLEIILNLKAVRFKPKVELPSPLVLEFKTQKEGIVKAREILTGPEVEVVNPNLKIAEITEDIKLKESVSEKLNKLSLNRWSIPDILSKPLLSAAKTTAADAAAPNCKALPGISKMPSSPSVPAPKAATPKEADIVPPMFSSEVNILVK